MDVSSTFPVFFRCKNEGLLGPPVSVEWAYATVDRMEIVSAIHLIKPPADWLPLINPDEASNIVRGVSLADLKTHGDEPALISLRMNQALRNRPLFSLFPDDADDLHKLFEVADAQFDFEVNKGFAESLIIDLARRRGIRKAAYSRLERKAQLRAPIYWPSVALAQMYAMWWADVAEAI